jgi:hypothetical protein
MDGSARNGGAIFCSIWPPLVHLQVRFGNEYNKPRCVGLVAAIKGRGPRAGLAYERLLTFNVDYDTFFYFGSGRSRLFP